MARSPAAPAVPAGSEQDRTICDPCPDVPGRGRVRSGGGQDVDRAAEARGSRQSAVGGDERGVEQLGQGQVGAVGAEVEVEVPTLGLHEWLDTVHLADGDVAAAAFDARLEYPETSPIWTMPPARRSACAATGPS